MSGPVRPLKNIKEKIEEMKIDIELIEPYHNLDHVKDLLSLIDKNIDKFLSYEILDTIFKEKRL